MDDKQFNKTIGFGVMVIIAYYIVQMIIPFLIYGVICMVIWRVYLSRNKFK